MIITFDSLDLHSYHPDISRIRFYCRVTRSFDAVSDKVSFRVWKIVPSRQTVIIIAYLCYLILMRQCESFNFPTTQQNFFQFLTFGIRHEKSLYNVWNVYIHNSTDVTLWKKFKINFDSDMYKMNCRTQKDTCWTV